ncbi:MAG: hypothetical protein LBK62_02680 [Treponema sp.]|jgi:hypothetical protein|nr:hypothetical protein [Treponema sp.]
MSAIDDIKVLCFENLEQNPNGLRYSDLFRLVKAKYPTMKYGTITGGLRIFYQKNASTVYKPEKGLFRLLKFQNQLPQLITPPVATVSAQISEKDFYSSFADWLVDELEECTKAKELGGNIFGSKWGTPDVIGVLKPLPIDIIKNELEIISAEIKLATNELITAFGQSCSYKLFSHKVYLVIPVQSSQDEISRLDSLCYLFGIGFVLYDCTNPDNPNYQLKNRAQKASPDPYYINQNINKARDFFNELLT